MSIFTTYVYTPSKVSINRYIVHLLPNSFKKKTKLLSSPSPPFVAATTLTSYGTPSTIYIHTYVHTYIHTYTKDSQRTKIKEKTKIPRVTDEGWKSKKQLFDSVEKAKEKIPVSTCIQSTLHVQLPINFLQSWHILHVGKWCIRICTYVAMFNILIY